MHFIVPDIRRSIMRCRVPDIRANVQPIGVHHAFLSDIRFVQEPIQSVTLWVYAISYTLL